MKSLKQKTLKGLFWSGFDTFGVTFFKFIFSIAIARILSPEDYGIVGMMAIFIAVATMISDSGFQTALIQKKEADLYDFSTVFYFNLIISVLLYFVFFFTADLIADFYNEPRLVAIAKTISLILIINSFCSIHATIYLKNINLKTFANVNIISSIVSGCIGLSLAVKGFGVWAIIFQTLAGSLFRAISYWVLNPWRPLLKFSFQSLKELYAFGYKIFLQSISDSLFMNIYYPLIGKFYDAVTLGFYTRAEKFKNLSVLQFTIIVSKVMFPVLSSLQDDKTTFNRTCIRSYRLIVFSLYPAMTILILTAEPFVHLLLTEKWLPVVPYMQLLYLDGFFFPFYKFNLNIFNSLGRSDLSLKIDIFKKIFLLLSIIVGIHYGIKGLIIGQLASSCLSLFITLYYCKKKIGYNFKNQLKDIFPSLSVSVIIFIVFKYIVIPIDNLLIILLIQTSGGAVLYLFIMRIIKEESYIDFKKLVSPYLPHKLKFLV